MKVLGLTHLQYYLLWLNSTLLTQQLKHSGYDRHIYISWMILYMYVRRCIGNADSIQNSLRKNCSSILVMPFCAKFVLANLSQQKKLQQKAARFIKYSNGCIGIVVGSVGSFIQ